MRTLFVACLFLTLCVDARAFSEITINSDNFNSTVGGDHHVFIKYTHKNCAECQTFDVIWSKIVEKYSGNTDALFGVVDCEKNVGFCDQRKISKFPTVQYFCFDSIDAQEYTALKDEVSLNKFFEEYLAPECSFERQDICNEKQTQWLEKNFYIRPSDLDDIIEKRQEDFEKISKSFNEYIEDLNEKYKVSRKKYDEMIDGTHRDLKWFRSIRKDLFKTKNDKEL